MIRARRPRGRSSVQAVGPRETAEDETHANIVRWVARAVLAAPGPPEEFMTSETFELLGLPGSWPAKRKTMARLHELAAEEPEPCILSRNVEALGEALGLDRPERLVLAFLAAYATVEELESAVDRARRSASNGVLSVMARVLDLPVAEVRHAMRAGGVLSATRIVNPDRDGLWRLRPSLAEGLPELLFSEHRDPGAVLEWFFRVAPQSSLRERDFDWVKDWVTLCRDILQGALRERTMGVNLLIHGAPGTGKTEMARVLAALVKANLYQVTTADVRGDAVPGKARLPKYALTQRLLASMSRALVLFDEMEDAFDTSTAIVRHAGCVEPGKAWMNQLLEQNQVPTIWISNDIGDMDRAYIRRFDVVFELRAPPREVRHRMLAERVDGLEIPANWLARVCGDERLSPAIAERAARTTRLTGTPPGEAAARTLDRVIHGMLDAQGPARSSGAPLSPAPYDLSYVQASVDLEQLAAGLARCGRGTVCLYGPPGTGKTAFARHLAERAGKPLLLRRASDLLGSFVGENEQKLAEMFARARAEDAVLLLDEADGFLRERSMARNGWEVTQVNELLVQMEAFEGVFLCATNLFDALDQAALRRFDLKVRLDPLDQTQRVRLFAATLGAAGRVEPGDGVDHTRALADLAGLTPGDYATVARRAYVLGEALDAARLLGGLRDEWRLKRQGSGRPVGFAENTKLR